MRKFVRKINEFLSQSAQMNNPVIKPTIKPGAPTKPGKPGPIPTVKPSVEPKPQASANDIYNHFIDTLRSIDQPFDFNLNYLIQKYEGQPTVKPTVKPSTPTKPGPIPTVKPSIEPKPQALGQFENFSIKSFGQFVNEARHEDNPAFSDEYNMRFPERIRQEAGETQGRVMGRNVSKIMPEVVGQILSIQRGYEKELEQLAYDVVMEYYGSILQYVDLDIRFPKNRNEAKEIMQDVPKKVEMTEIKDRRTIAEINRRKVGKMMMQGEAKASKTLLNMAAEGLAEILGEETAITYRNLLNQIGDIAHIADLVTPEEVMLGYWSQGSPVGVVNVEWQPEEVDEKSAEDILAALEAGEEPDEETVEEVFSGSYTPKITAIGNDFAMLLHETIKGIWQLIISAAIPEDKELAKNVIENTDTLADEIEDLKYGPFMVKDIDRFIKQRYSSQVESIENFKERLFGKMIIEPNPMTFLKMVRAILMEDYSPKAMTRLDQLAQQVEDELLEYEAQMREYEMQMRDYEYSGGEEEPIEYPQEFIDDSDELSDDLENLTIDQLRQKLNDAISEEDYMLASEINKIIRRKSTNESKKFIVNHIRKFQ